MRLLFANKNGIIVLLTRNLTLKKKRGVVMRSVKKCSNIKENENDSFLCIDLKSYYASVECVDRGLDPMTTNLVVADAQRSKNTICLAITPAMKKLGVKNRCRLGDIPGNLEYIVAPPRMQRYIDISADIYEIYLKYIAPEDIHVYSIDEAFMDVTHYLKLYKLDACGLGKKIMDEIFDSIGVRSTCGVGTNLYLAKIALDIISKHSPDFMGYLDEEIYKEKLWGHQPLTDFWRIGPGTAKRLAKYGILTMGDIARTDKDFLYRLFGIDAELLIDHAFGREPVRMMDIKAYRPKANSLSSGQVLMRDYNFEEGRIIATEMMDLLSLDMVVKNLVCKSVSLSVGYSNSVSRGGIGGNWNGHGFDNACGAGGTVKFELETNAETIMIPAIKKLYDKVVDRGMPIRRMQVCCNNVVPEICRQYSFFQPAEELEKVRRLQQVIAEIKLKYGKNLVLKGVDYEEAATTRERNEQIGGHRMGAEDEVMKMSK